MRAKIVNEKFNQESDPVKDMGIVRICFGDAFERIVGPAAKEWYAFIKQLEGKRISGSMLIKVEGSHEDVDAEILVHKVRLGLDSEVTILTKDTGWGCRTYVLKSTEKYTIK